MGDRATTRRQDMTDTGSYLSDARTGRILRLNNAGNEQFQDSKLIVKVFRRGFSFLLEVVRAERLLML